MNYKNLISGLLFVSFSLLFLFNTEKLPIGTMAEIGPAFFPTVIAVCLFVVGMSILFKKTDD